MVKRERPNPTGGSPPDPGIRRLRTELERRAAELEECEARFRNIIERTADGIVIVGEDRRIRFVNSAAEALFARGAEELRGEDFGFPAIAGESTEIELVRPDGQARLIAELRVSATLWEGTPAQLVSLRDVTDRKAAEERAHRLVLERAAREQAEKASQRSRFLAEASATLDASLDPQTTLENLARLVVPRVADWCVIDLLEGDGVRRVAGVHADPLRQPLLQELSERFPPRADSPQPSALAMRSRRAELLRDLTSGRIVELTVDAAHARLLERLGAHSAISVPLQVRERLLGAITFVCAERNFDEEDVALTEEIASRAAAALENARLYEVALAASRAKSDFLALMSHELRTPLNAILGYAEILLTGVSGELDEPQREQIGRIRASATRLLEILAEILIYAGMEAGREPVRPRSVRLRDLVEETAAIVEPAAREKGLDFRLEVQQPGATLFTDPDKLRHVALNLLTNAVKFTERGYVTLRAELDGEDLLLSVSDTGRGIAPEDREMMFEPFWQAEDTLTRSSGGTGLGLSISRRLAELLGGSLTVASRAGQGSTFTLQVPASHPAGPTA